MRRGYGHAIQAVAASYVSPVYWAPLPRDQNIPSLNHGTIFFLKCGGPILGITAEHVYAAYLERKSVEPALICQIGKQKRVIGRDSSLDLVTFEIREPELGSLGKIAHEPPDREWPPSPPTEGKGVFLCGFPLSGRSFRNSHELDFESVCLGLVADRVDDRTVMCQFHREEWLDNSGDDTQGEQIEMGGMSGAPLWALIQRRGVESWSLSGIVVQFNPAFELLRARRPNLIKPNGHIGT